MIYLWNNNFNIGVKSFSYTFEHDIDCQTHINYPAEIVVCLSGTVKIIIDNNEHILKKNDMILIKSMHPHTFITESSNEVLILCFVETLSSNFFSNIKNRNFKRSITHLSDSLIGYIMEILTRKKIVYPYHLSDIEVVLSIFTNEIMHNNQLIPDKNPNRALAITQAIVYITENYNKNITLDDVSVELGINRTYVSHMFHKYLNVSFTDILNSIRINHALRMLQNKEDLIANIAYQCGFNSIRSFNRVFKKYLNITPSEFRRDNSLYMLRYDKLDFFDLK